VMLLCASFGVNDNVHLLVYGDAHFCSYVNSFF
jgi:hypothetical protein